MMTILMTAGLSCREVAASGSAFVDGELSGTMWMRFRMHIFMCASCLEYLEQLQITVDTLRDLPGDEGAELRGALVSRFRVWADEQPSHDTSPG